MLTLMDSWWWWSVDAFKESRKWRYCGGWLRNAKGRKCCVSATQLVHVTVVNTDGYFAWPRFGCPSHSANSRPGQWTSAVLRGEQWPRQRNVFTCCLQPASQESMLRTLHSVLCAALEPVQHELRLTTSSQNRPIAGLVLPIALVSTIWYIHLAVFYSCPWFVPVCVCFAFYHGKSATQDRVEELPRPLPQFRCQFSE